MSGLFKAYDIRGIYGPEINEKFAERLAFALIKYIKPKNVVIGYDSRHGNVQLFSAIAKVMLDNGVEVIHIGLVSRPMLNWVVFKHEYDMGIAITASHNPREFNGFKIVKKGAIPMDYDTGLSDVEKLMNNSTAKKAVKNKKRRTSNKLQVVSRDFINEYVDFLSSHLSKDAKKGSCKK